MRGTVFGVLYFGAAVLAVYAGYKIAAWLIDKEF